MPFRYEAKRASYRDAVKCQECGVPKQFKHQDSCGKNAEPSTAVVYKLYGEVAEESDLKEKKHKHGNFRSDNYSSHGAFNPKAMSCLYALHTYLFEKEAEQKALKAEDWRRRHKAAPDESD